MDNWKAEFEGFRAADLKKVAENGVVVSKRLSGEGLHSQPHATNPHLRAATADLSVYAGDEAGRA